MKTYLFMLLFFWSNFVFGQEKKVAIVGGGMSGVSAAFYILEKDSTAKITIYEKENVLGGNAQTISVKNKNGQLVNIDVGPQYFAKGPWNTYIDFLSRNGLFNENEFSKFHASIVVFNKKEHQPKFVSPKGVKFRGEKLGNILSFAKFYSKSRKVLLGKKAYPAHIGDWVSSLPLKDKFKTEFVLPFLASSLGTSILDIKRTDTKEVVSLFAFKSMLSSEPFYVSNYGMGSLIKKIGAKLEQRGVSVHTNAEVLSVSKNANGYNIKTASTEENFDFVVFATHPYQASKLLSAAEFSLLKANLANFEYFIANIVIHRDSTCVKNDFPSFLNIETDIESKEVLSSTMNLVEINPLFTGLYKSWLSEAEMEQIKQKGLFEKNIKFYHPLISPEFKTNLMELKKLSKDIDNMYFSGGWSEGLETQETAIISGKNAAEWYLKFKTKH